jgi:hypothetical protein
MAAQRGERVIFISYKAQQVVCLHLSGGDKLHAAF